jgi:hypothetical protein
VTNAPTDDPVIAVALPPPPPLTIVELLPLKTVAPPCTPRPVVVAVEPGVGPGLVLELGPVIVTQPLPLVLAKATAAPARATAAHSEPAAAALPMAGSTYFGWFIISLLFSD